MTSVAVDVGGTFTDVCVLDQTSGELAGGEGAVDAGPDRRRDGRRRARPASTSRDVVAVLSRHDGRDERADHPPPAEGRDGDDARLPRRGRDPPRHQRRPVGRLQGRRPAVHPPPRPPRGDRAGRLRRRGDRRRSTRTRRARSRAILRRREVETVAVCFINAYANAENEQRDARDPRGGARRT